MFWLPRRPRGPVDGSRLPAAPAERPGERLRVPADAGGRKRRCHGPWPSTCRSQAEWGADTQARSRQRPRRTSSGRKRREKGNQSQHAASHDRRDRGRTRAGVRGRAQGLLRDPAEGDGRGRGGPRVCPAGRTLVRTAALRPPPPSPSPWPSTRGLTLRPGRCPELRAACHAEAHGGLLPAAAKSLPGGQE